MTILTHICIWSFVYFLIGSAFAGVLAKFTKESIERIKRDPSMYLMIGFLWPLAIAIGVIGGFCYGVYFVFFKMLVLKLFLGLIFRVPESVTPITDLAPPVPRRTEPEEPKQPEEPKEKPNRFEMINLD